MLAYQLVRRLMAAAAAKHWKKPTEISFLNAARWTLGFSKIMSMARTEDMPLLYERLLRAIAASKADVDPGRIETRAVAPARAKARRALRQVDSPQAIPWVLSRTGTDASQSESAKAFSLNWPSSAAPVPSTRFCQV